MRLRLSRQNIFTILSCLFLLSAAIAGWPTASTVAQSEYDTLKKMRDASKAISNPDELAWQQFAEINQRAVDDKCPDLSTGQQRNSDNPYEVCWERWADSGAKGNVYGDPKQASLEWPTPKHPQPFRPQRPALDFLELKSAIQNLKLTDLADHKLPKLPLINKLNNDQRATLLGKLQALLQLEFVRGERKLSQEESMSIETFLNDAVSFVLEIEDQDEYEEIRMNRVAFDYVAGNGLWFVEGQREILRAGGSISFPLGSIEVKAEWKPICRQLSDDDCEKQQEVYHSKIYKNEVWGLHALNMMYKSLPDWIWATWEHKNNLDRWKAPTLRDSFGYPFTAPQVDRPSLGLIGLFDNAKVKLVNEWFSYRLNGTQTSFVDANDKPTLLGNSVIEHDILETSSCITCHSEGVVDQFGHSSVRTLGRHKAPGWPDSERISNTCHLSLDFVLSLMNAKCKYYPQCVIPGKGAIPGCGE